MYVRRSVRAASPLLAHLVCAALALACLAVPANAQYSTTPPTPDPARWNGRPWAVVDMEPKVIRPGDTAVLEAQLRSGGPATAGFYCSSGAGWRVQGTENVTLKYSSACFDLVDYEPKASQFVNVSVSRSQVAWAGLPGPLPTASVARELNPNAGADCYCHVDWWGARSVTSGCSRPIGTFSQGYVFRLYLKAKPVGKASSWCSTNGKYMLTEAATFGGNYGPGWSDAAETYYRFDMTNTGGSRPVPAIAAAANPVTVPIDQTSTITATVTDPATGKAMPGQRVNFSTSVGMLTSLSEYTDANGVATVALSADGKAGTARVRAGVGGEEAASYVTVQFTSDAPAPTEPEVIRRYFAEGSTGWHFTTDLSLVNPSDSAARTTLKFLTDSGASIDQELTIPARGQRSVRLNTDVEGLGQAAVSTVIESTVPIVADRTMTWAESGYGSHSETAVAEPRTTWYFAEGATHSGLSTFYLIQNPGTAPVDLTVTYLRPAPLPPVKRSYTVAAHSRFNIWVNLEGPELASTDVSAVITASAPVIAERAMYLDGAGQPFAAGHESAAIPEPTARWFFAEGSTGPYFDLFILVANPGTAQADVRATYLLPDGTTISKEFPVAPQSRFNIWVDYEDTRLANTAVATIIESLNGVPVIAERSMWWPGTGWAEAHNAAGSTVTGSRWAIADGRQGGPQGADTYLLIANTSDTDGYVIVTLLFEDGKQQQRGFTVAARSRFNVSVGNEFPGASGRRFGAVVEAGASTPVQLVVERAVYSNANGVAWAAGSDALAARLQ